MDIKDRRILVLGGFGMVGQAICHELLSHGPEHLTISSLSKEEAEKTVSILGEQHPATSIEAAWGNIFVRESFKDLSRTALLQDPDNRLTFLHDALDELDEEVVQVQTLYRLIEHSRPDLIVDCINTATALAYQNVYSGSREVVMALETGDPGAIEDTTVRLVATQYTPQLIRHVQVLYSAMRKVGTGMYLKVGTTGTGGMGLNIPYTHSEERPSRMLLSKSAMAGAHSMLLFLMGRTPDGPIVKEVKPAAVIAWKAINKGPVLKGNKPIPLYDMSPEDAHSLEDELQLELDAGAFKQFDGDKVLDSVYIDTGENGFFSTGEFTVITSIGQMEFITPEEIAGTVIREIQGGNTGYDIIAALDMSVMGPTYRAGASREAALKRLNKLEEEHGVRSVAFEVLGPPRLSKLLYEAELLRRTAGTLRSVAAASAEELSTGCLALLESDAELRSSIISIGIPILLPDGRLMRGPVIKIPPPRGRAAEPIDSDRVEQWAASGWVDLRVDNMFHWQKRAAEIISEIDAVPDDESSSKYHRDRAYWAFDLPLDIGKTVGWIFTREDKGERMK